MQSILRYTLLTLTLILGLTSLRADFIYDAADILNPSTEAQLNSELQQFQDAKKVTAVIVTVKSLEGKDIASFSNERFRQLAIGEEGKNNGVMLLVAPNEKQVRFEVGYGLEGDLTDAKARNIIEKHILPKFKTNAFSDGVIAGLREVEQVYGWQPQLVSPAKTPVTKDYTNVFITIGVLIAIAVVAFPILCMTLGVADTIDLYLSLFLLILRIVALSSSGTSRSSGGSSGGGGSSSRW